jgi:tetratricopeptide (TPR) repeat protein
MNLGSSLSDIGRLEEARQKYHEALMIYENNYSLEHVETSFLYYNIGLLFCHSK